MSLPTVLLNGQATAVSATDLIEPQLVTVPGIEICEVGEEWQLSTGPLTLTTAHLQAAAEAYHNDPAVHAPRVRFGHTTEWPVASEPAFGTYQNLRVENDGMTLVGDLTGVPKWFADIAAAAYPNRSMDGWTDATTHTGKTHALVIEAVSFLGVVMPGINTLEDLAGVWSATAPEGTQVAAGTRIHAKRGGVDVPAKPVAAAVGTDDLRKVFYNDFAEGDRYWWWIRQTFLSPQLLIVDDDEGQLYAMTYTVNGDVVEFGEPQEIFTQYVYTASGQVAAGRGENPEPVVAYLYKDSNRVAASGAPEFVIKPGSDPAAVYASAAESRPADHNKEAPVAKPTNATTLSVDRNALIARLGLAEDATEEEITAALAAPVEEDKTDDTETDDETEDAPEGDPAKASTLTRTVDAATFDDMQRRLKGHDESAVKAERTRRDGIVEQAASKGRITRARKAAWRTAYDKDPEGTETLLTASVDKGGLPENMVPVEEIGTDATESVSASAGGTPDDKQQAYYNRHFPELVNAGKD